MTDAPPAPADSLGVRTRLVEALKLDLVGPWAGHELGTEQLPGRERPSNWYVAGFLIRTGTPPDRSADADEDDDLDTVPESAGLAEESNDERKAARGAAPRGDRPAGGPVDRTGVAARSAQGLRARRRDADARSAGAVTDRRLDWAPHDVIRARLLAAAPRDVDELLPQLAPRAKNLAELETRRLREWGEWEARDLDETLRRQRERMVEEFDRHEGQFKQIALEFDEEERRQLQSTMRYWRMRLDQFDRDLEPEPRRTRAFRTGRVRTWVGTTISRTLIEEPANPRGRRRRHDG